MHWRIKNRGRNYVVWHRWFAWCPVKTEDGFWVWFERVWRVGHHERGGHGNEPVWVWKYSYAHPPSVQEG